VRKHGGRIRHAGKATKGARTKSKALGPHRPELWESGNWDGTEVELWPTLIRIAVVV
jgi:hypothetical protein